MIFTKMQGAGNDYIYVDCTKTDIKNPEKTSKFLSNRHFGIGADGLVLIKKSEKADFFMDMYNADGSRGKMCGNAIRCVAKYVYDNKLTDKKHLKIDTLSGIKDVQLQFYQGEAAGAKVGMGQPILSPALLPSKAKGENFVNKSIRVADKDFNCTLVSMGNPHCVMFIENTEDIDVYSIGSAFEKSEFFPEGVNTEFVKVLNDSHLVMRVWERGSGETLACGTGACAAVVAAILNGHCEKDQEIRVTLIGGELFVTWRSEDNSVILDGGATKVFVGEIEL